MSIVDEIVAENAHPDTVGFTVGDRLIVVRVPKSAQELITNEKMIGSMVKAIKEGRCTPELQPYSGCSRDIIRMALWISRMCVEPKFTTAEALRLAEEAGAWFLMLSSKLMAAMGLAAEEAAEEAVENEGEDSAQAVGSPNGQSSAETSTDAPLKN